MSVLPVKPGMRPVSSVDMSGLKTSFGNASVFALGIIGGLNVKTAQASEDAGIIFDEALRNVREAYKFLTDTGETNNNFLAGAQQISAEDQAKINELNFALERLQAASLNSSSAISLLT